MSKQIAVRLPDETVEFIDRQVGDGNVASRAAFVQRAIERERRRLLAVRDVELLSGQTDDEAFDDLAAHAAGLDTGLR